MRVRRKKKYGNEVGLEEVAQIRAAIADQTAHISQSDTFQVGKLIKLITEFCQHPFTHNQLRHLRRVQLLRPHVHDSGDRKTHRYNRIDLQDVLVILSLIHDHHLPLSKVGGLLWAEERYRHTRFAEARRGVPVSVSHDQMGRAQFLLRGRLFEIVSTWLFGGQALRNTIIILRRQPYHHRTEITAPVRVVANDEDWVRVDKDKILYRRPDDITLTIGSNGEALHRTEPLETEDYYAYRWHHLLLQGDQPMADYHLIIGTPPNNGLCLAPIASSLMAAKLLEPLLRLCFIQQVENGIQADTPLQAMANMIPDISSYWQYCAILTLDPMANKSLVALAHSAHFPRNVNLGTILLSPEQLLSGWTYQTGQVCVVQQSIGRDDPRIARQSEEQATAALAVPTLVDSRVNGVIYVGTQHPATDDEVFSEPKIGFLRLLGSIVGELIERESISQRTRQIGLHILEESPLQVRSWPELVSQLEPILKSILHADKQYDRLDNIHVMAVRVDNYFDIQTRSPEVANWGSELLARTAHNFFSAHQGVSPTLFQRNSAEFVILVNHLRVDDKLEQKLRQELQDHLNTLVLSFDQGVHPVAVKCLVWSLSFRYSVLVNKLAQADERCLALTLQQEIESALTTLPHISAAHLHEASGAYQLAHNELYLAHKLAPHNTYLMRHLAKVCTRMGDYNNAIGWWERVLSHEQHPRFYQRLAEVYALLPDYPAALERYRLAAATGPDDPRCYLGWGQVLLAMGNFAMALDKFIAAQTLDKENQALYALRQAEAYAGMEEYGQAKWACERALILDRDNSDAIKLLLQIQPKCRQ